MLPSQGGAALALGYYRRLPPGGKSFSAERHLRLLVREIRTTCSCDVKLKLRKIDEVHN